MKYILPLFLLFFAFNSFSQSEKELIEDCCNCFKTINSNLNLKDKKKSIMDCTLNAFKENRNYTEKVVKEFTGKNEVDGEDVFLYLQEVFNDILIDNCSEYKLLMSQILEIRTFNPIIEKVGDEICANLPKDLSEKVIKETIDSITQKNYNEISKTYSKEKGAQYISDMRDYLIFYCGKYKNYLDKKYN
jgi:hypothetical protein